MMIYFLSFATKLIVYDMTPLGCLSFTFSNPLFIPQIMYLFNIVNISRYMSYKIRKILVISRSDLDNIDVTMQSNFQASSFLFFCNPRYFRYLNFIQLGVPYSCRCLGSPMGFGYVLLWTLSSIMLNKKRHCVSIY